MTIGEMVANARIAQNMSQRELGKKCGISPAEISRIESGRRQKPAAVSLQAIAAALGLDAGELWQTAGYAMPQEKPKAPEKFRIGSGDSAAVYTLEDIQKIVETDPEWANIAFTVSRECSEHDRKMLTDICLLFLDRSR